MAQMKRSGRVSRDVFQENGLTGVRIGAAVGRTLFQNFSNDILLKRRCEFEIDESGAGNLNGRKHLGVGGFFSKLFDQFVRNDSRRLLHGFCTLERHCAGNVTVALLFGALENNFGVLRSTDGRQSILEKLGDFGFL